MVRFGDRIICVFEKPSQFVENAKGPICKIPSDHGSFVVLDRTNTISPEFNGSYSKRYIVKILKTIKTRGDKEIRFGIILPTTMERFFYPLRQAVKARIADVDWGEGYGIVDGGKLYQAYIKIELEGIEYEYKLVLRPDGSINAFPDGVNDWSYVIMENASNFEFPRAEIAGLVKIPEAT